MDARSDARGARSYNVVALGLAQVVTFLANAVVQVVLARYLGKAGFGTYATLASIVQLASFLAGLNVHVLLARSVARAPDKAGVLLSRALQLTLALSVPAIGVVVAYAAVAMPSLVGVALVAAVAMVVLQLQEVVEAAYQGLRRMHALVPAGLVARLGLVVATVGFLIGGLGLYGVFLAQILGFGLGVLGLLGWFLARVDRVPLRLEPAEVARLGRDAVPFGLMRLYTMAYVSADFVILALFTADDEIGLYRAASVFVLQLPVLAMVLSRSLYPRLSVLVGDRGRAGAELGVMLRILLAVSVPMAVGGMLVAEPLLTLIFDAPYAAAAPLLLVVLPMIPLRFVNLSMALSLSALDRQDWRTRTALGAAVVNIGANFALVPVLGAMGAALTTLGTEVLLTLALWWLVRREVGPLGEVRALLTVGVSAAAMAPAVWVTSGLPVAVPILVGAGVYAVVAVLSGALRRSDLTALRSL